MKIPVYLWRFQPFHSGHRSIVDKILAEYPSMIMIIGSSEKSWQDENPWNYFKRIEIIGESLPEEVMDRITMYPLNDTPDDDEWCCDLKKIIPDNSIVYTGNEWVRGICEKYNIETEWITPTIDISGTKIREMVWKWEDVSEWTKIS